jgi:hypothetical protein
MKVYLEEESARWRPSVMCGVIGVVTELMVRMQPALDSGLQRCDIIYSINR